MSTAAVVLPPGPDALIAYRVQRVYALAALPALVILVGTYPRAWGIFARRGVIAGIAALGTLATIAAVLRPDLEATAALVPRDGALVLRTVTLGPLSALVSMTIGGTGILAWHFAGMLRKVSPAEERSRLLLALAFTVYPLWRLSRVLRNIFWPTDDAVQNRALLSPTDLALSEALDWFYVLCLLFAAWAAVRIVRHQHARGRGIGALVFLFATMAILGSTWGVFLANDIRVFDFGFATLFLPIVATYALLRGDLLGLDGRVRFALSRSTIAAAFIAVFFIASEAAQQFFGDTLGSTYVGIAAAGALVFAMAPLQRAAERIAERAVPRPPTQTDPTSAQTTYRLLLARMMMDGRITRDEERALAHAATSLGLSHQEAIQIRHDLEDERPRGDA